MKFQALVPALLLVSLAPSASEAPFHVDVERVLELAVTAIEERYPGIAAENLAVENGIDFQCWSTRPNDDGLALNEEFRPCFATVQFVFVPAEAEFRFVNGKGNCEVAKGPQDLHVSMLAGDSINVGLKPRNGGVNRTVDCTDAFGDQAPTWTEHSLDDDAYGVEVKKIVKTAFESAIAKYPDVSPDDMELGIPMVRVSCEPDASEGITSVGDTKFVPCRADVVLSSPSTFVEYRYVDTDGKCKISRGPENIKVRVGGGEIDPDCARGSYGETEVLVVECTEEFDDADRWTSN